MSFKLNPIGVGDVASNTILQGVLTEPGFHTARHGMKCLICIRSFC